MTTTFHLPTPQFIPPLDPGFRPAALANRAFRARVVQVGGGVPLVIGLERSQGEISRYETSVFPSGHPEGSANLVYAERLLKFLLWQRGGWKIWVGGPPEIAAHLSEVYSPRGPRRFDHDFMGAQVYQRDFTFVSCQADAVPQQRKRKASRAAPGWLPCRL
jgi:hypothetical protein